jgi:hypothetical protein
VVCCLVDAIMSADGRQPLGWYACPIFVARNVNSVPLSPPPQVPLSFEISFPVAIAVSVAVGIPPEQARPLLLTLQQRGQVRMGRRRMMVR